MAAEVMKIVDDAEKKMAGTADCVWCSLTETMMMAGNLHEISP